MTVYQNTSLHRLLPGSYLYQNQSSVRYDTDFARVIFQCHSELQLAQFACVPQSAGQTRPSLLFDPLKPDAHLNNI